MAGTGFHCFAKLRAQMFNPVLADRGVHSIDILRTAKVRWLNLRAECHGPDSSAVFYRTAAVRGEAVRFPIPFRLLIRFRLPVRL
jgi:hypothetical protein